MRENSDANPQARTGRGPFLPCSADHEQNGNHIRLIPNLQKTRKQLVKQSMEFSPMPIVNSFHNLCPKGGTGGRGL